MAHDGSTPLVPKLRELGKDIVLRGLCLVGDIKSLVRLEVRELALNDHLQAYNLLLILPEESILGVLVHNWPVLDELGPARVSQRAQRLFIVVVGRRNCRDHYRFRVSSQRIT